MGSAWKANEGRSPGVKHLRVRGVASTLAVGLAMCCMMVLGAIPAEAQQRLRLGVRAGYAELDGSFLNENLEAKDQKLFGVQAIFPMFGDRVSLQLAGEGTSDDLTFTESSVASAVEGEVDWSDLAIYTSLRADLMPVSMFGLYVGAGIGVHFTEIDPDLIADAFEEAGRDLQDEYNGESSDLEWHGLVGLDFHFGNLVEVFGEGRFRRVEGEFERDGFAGYLGVNLILD